MQIGMIGLGAMGMHMARNLHRRGELAGVWNRTAHKAQALADELQIKAFGSPADLAQHCDTIVICVSADADLRAVVSALLPGLQSGALVIDCSTVSADTARAMQASLAGCGAAFLDCPVSGGVEGARLATLAIMAGGESRAFQRATPLLNLLGRTITHFGDCGAGQAAKATNQIMCAGIIRAVAEAMAFARAQNLPLPALVETLGQGAGSSWYFVHRAPNMISGEYPPGFRVRLHYKDLQICHDMAAAAGVTLPVVQDMLAEYAELIAGGFGDEDISAVYRLKQALFDQAR